jgi:predicted nucleic acid-binding Zn ribbon protein
MARTHDDPQALRGLLRDLGGRIGMGGALEAATLRQRWNEIVGDAIAAHAEPSSLKDGVLRIRADSPAWATEISYLGAQIAARSNDLVGSEIVTEVRVWTGPGRVPAPAPGSVPMTAPVPRPVVPDDPLEALRSAHEAWRKRHRRRRNRGDE